MIFEIEKSAILDLVCMQVKNIFTITDNEICEIEDSFEDALLKCDDNFQLSGNKYFTRQQDVIKVPYFNPFHSVEYMIFLYYLAHLIYKKGSTTPICDKLYYLNKMLNSVDLFYAIELPAHFSAEHPVGSVMGRAKYGDNLYFYQNCTVGGVETKDGSEVYPVLGDNLLMCANSAILGNCHIGNDVKLGAGAIIKNQDVPNNSLVFGQSPNLIIKNHKNG